MNQLKLIGFEKKEIENISGKGIAFKKISIQGENCSNFLIQYEISDQENEDKFSSFIHCFVSPYQRDVTQVILNKSILIPKYCRLTIQMHSALKPNFTGETLIDYEFLSPSDNLVFISENDRQYARRVALISLARFYNIPDYEYDDNKILYNKIKGIPNQSIVKLLQDYFKAYDEWFKFYEVIKVVETKTGQRHDLTITERDELQTLSQNREKTLNALQTKFDKLQFEKFKKSHGLENVDGLEL